MICLTGPGPLFSQLFSQLSAQSLDSSIAVGDHVLGAELTCHLRKCCRFNHHVSPSPLVNFYKKRTPYFVVLRSSPSLMRWWFNENIDYSLTRIYPGIVQDYN